MLATTVSPCSRAMRMSCKWPSWRLPIVGTNTILPRPARRACRSAEVVTMSMARVGPKATRCLDAMLRTGEGAVLHRLDVARDGRFNIAASGHEIAHEACELAGIDAEHIVENKHLTIAPRTGAD